MANREGFLLICGYKRNNNNINVVSTIYPMQGAQIVALKFKIHPHRRKPIPAFRFHGRGMDAQRTLTRQTRHFHLLSRKLCALSQSFQEVGQVPRGIHQEQAADLHRVLLK